MSKVIDQKSAVYNTVKSVLAEHGFKFEDGMKVELSKDQREQCVSMLVHGFETGSIELKSEQENLKSYCGGLLSNWLRKDKRFNGGTQYKPENPGVRTGMQDPQVKNLRILLSTLPEGSAEYEAVEAKITERVAEIKADKAKASAKAIDINAIPEEFRHLITK